MDVWRERKDPEDSHRLASPQRRSVRTWAGPGSGASCDLCKRKIGTHEIEYEVELMVQSAPQLLRFHVTCHQEWAAGAISLSPAIMAHATLEDPQGT
jgi:hypothetical protein